MIDDVMVAEVHRKANERLFKLFPLLDMANIEKHPEGHWGVWEIEWILEEYENLRKPNQKIDRLLGGK